MHLGVEEGFRPARKAHPAFVVRDLPALVEVLHNAGVEVRPNPDAPTGDGAYLDDPFGNRIELIAEGCTWEGPGGERAEGGGGRRSAPLGETGGREIRGSGVPPPA